MEKKNRPLQAANSDIRVSDITPLTKSLQAPKRTPKKHRARVYMLRTGIEGWTENDILRYCRLSSGRNYATELGVIKCIMALTFEWNSRSGIEVYGFPQLNDCAYIAIVVVTPRAGDPLPFV